MSRTAVLLALAALAAVAGLWAGTERRQSSRKSPEPPLSQLRVDKSALAVGEVWEDGAFQRTLPVHNPTDGTVEVEDFRTSCTVSDIAPRKFTLGPGQTQNVSVKFKHRPDHGSRRQEAGYPFSVGVIPKVKGTNRTHDSWVIHGKAKPWIRAEKSCIHFGDISRFDQKPKYQSITITALAPIVRLDASCTTGWFSVTTRRLGDETSFELTIRTAQLAQQTLGPRDCSILLRGQTANGTVLPSSSLPIECRIVGDVVASSAQVVCGVAARGEVFKDVVTFTSLTGRAVVVQEVRVVGGRELSAEVRGSAQVIIRVVPMKHGKWSGEIQIRCQTEGEACDFIIPVSAYVAD